VRWLYRGEQRQQRSLSRREIASPSSGACQPGALERQRSTGFQQKASFVTTTSESQSDDYLSRQAWCDVTLRALRWLDRDAALALEISDGAGVPREIVCSWVTVFKMTIDTQGALLSWGGSLRRRELGGWSLQLDFAHAGSLEIECKEFSVLNIEPS
jgi:hypothetical protein